MDKIELVKSELAFYGIRVMDDQCLSFMEGQDEPVKSSCHDKIVQIKYEMNEYKLGVQQFWGKMRNALMTPQKTMVGGTVATEKMFATSLKHLLRFARKYRYFRRDVRLIQWALRRDVKRFNETTMSQVVDYKICIDWLNHLVRQGAYCASLISFYERSRAVAKPVTAQQLVPSGTMDMEGDEHDPLKERRWTWDENDFKDDTRPKNLEALVGNDPEWLNEGFQWYEPKNEPFLYGDMDNDPYAKSHYYNFKSEQHRDNKFND